jgi:hypothetical protein
MKDSRRQAADSRQQTAEIKREKPIICLLPTADCRPPSACRLPFAVSLASILLLFAALLLYDSATPAQSERRVISRHSGMIVIKQAIEQFQTVETIESKVRLECHFFGEKYRGSGFYFEKRLPMISEPAVSANRFLLDLQFQADSFLSRESSSSKLKIVAT